MPAPNSKKHGKDIPTLISEIDANVRQTESLASGLSSRQFNWTSAPGKWSIGQNLAHLISVNGPDLHSLEAAIKTGRDEGMTGKGPFIYGLLFRKFAASQEPPATRKFKAPKYLNPPAHVEPVPAIEEYQRISTELRRLVQAADGLHLACVKTDLSALPPVVRAIIKMPLGARLELLTAHDRRHLVQADEVRRHPQFPAD
jgi:hypothetical protein